MNAILRSLFGKPAGLFGFRRPACHARTGLIVLSVFHLLSVAGYTFPPAPLFDGELAQYPIVVEARWEKAPRVEHHRIEKQSIGKVITAFEIHTTLNVVRVIRGDLKPGIHALIVGSGIRWDENGRSLMSGTTTQVGGETEDLTQSNLWFLRPTTSWDKSDGKEYLWAGHYRVVQPMDLESFYEALASPNPDAKIPGILASDNAVAVQRMLKYLNGDRLPWPYGAPLQSSHPPKPRTKELPDAAKWVAVFATRKALADERGLAAAVFESMEGDKSIPFLRDLLTDSDANVRAAVAALLAKRMDNDSIPGINAAVTGKETGRLACEIIEALSRWNDVRLVPALAAYLESSKETFCGSEGRESPALASREVLHRLTGHWFPFGVEAALHAWEQASQIPDFEERRKFLEKIAPCDPNPLRALLAAGKGKNVTCTLTNKSDQAVVVTKQPYAVEQRSDSGSSWSYPEFGGADGKEEFITLGPGKSIRMKFTLGRWEPGSAPASRHLILTYTALAPGKAPGAWAGEVDVAFGGKPVGR